MGGLMGVQINFSYQSAFILKIMHTFLWQGPHEYEYTSTIKHKFKIQSIKFNYENNLTFKCYDNLQTFNYTTVMTYFPWSPGWKKFLNISHPHILPSACYLIQDDREAVWLSHELSTVSGNISVTCVGSTYIYGHTLIIVGGGGLCKVFS